MVVSKPVLRNESAFDKNIECVIDGGSRSLQTFGSYLREEFIGIKMPATLHDLFEENESLLRNPELVASKVLCEGLFFG
jgi:hypothetical protein